MRPKLVTSTLRSPVLRRTRGPNNMASQGVPLWSFYVNTFSGLLTRTFLLRVPRFPEIFQPSKMKWSFWSHLSILNSTLGKCSAYNMSMCFVFGCPHQIPIQLWKLHLLFFFLFFFCSLALYFFYAMSKAYRKMIAGLTEELYVVSSISILQCQSLISESVDPYCYFNAILLIQAQRSLFETSVFLFVTSVFFFVTWVFLFVTSVFFFVTWVFLFVTSLFLFVTSLFLFVTSVSFS